MWLRDAWTVLSLPKQGLPRPLRMNAYTPYAHTLHLPPLLLYRVQTPQTKMNRRPEFKGTGRRVNHWKVNLHPGVRAFADLLIKSIFWVGGAFLGAPQMWFYGWINTYHSFPPKRSLSLLTTPVPEENWEYRYPLKTQGPRVAEENKNQPSIPNPRKHSRARVNNPFLEELDINILGFPAIWSLSQLLSSTTVSWNQPETYINKGMAVFQ